MQTAQHSRKNRAVLYSAVRCNTMQCNAVRCDAVQNSTAQHSRTPEQCGAMQRRTEQNSNASTTTTTTTPAHLLIWPCPLASSSMLSALAPRAMQCNKQHNHNHNHHNNNNHNHNHNHSHKHSLVDLAVPLGQQHDVIRPRAYVHDAKVVVVGGLELHYWTGVVQNW
jgi:hypothetical protein